MNHTSRRRTWERLAPCAVALALLSLAGCQGHKIIARVNDAAINEEEYNDRAQRVAQLFPNTDAGGTALVSMIRERLTSQLATVKNAQPSPELVRRFAAYIRRTVPQIDDQIRAGRVTEEDLLRNARFQLEEFGIGTEGAKVTDKEIQDEFKAHEKDLVFPEIWTIRSLRVPNLEQGQAILTTLQKSGDFRGAARALGLQPMDVAAAGTEASFIARQATPALRSALEKLGPGQFTAAPIPLQGQNPQTGLVETIYVIAQMVQKTPSKPMTLEEVRPMLERTILEKKYPDWQVHKDQELAAFTSHANIQIYIKRYQTLAATFIRPTAEMHSATAPGGSLAPPPSSTPSAPGGTSVPNAPPSGTQ